MILFPFWIMFNLAIQDTMTGRTKERKCEWNWNANQDKQTLYTSAQVWLIALEGREIINFSTLHLHSVQRNIQMPAQFYS